MRADELAEALCFSLSLERLTDGGVSLEPGGADEDRGASIGWMVWETSERFVQSRISRERKQKYPMVVKGTGRGVECAEQHES